MFNRDRTTAASSPRYEPILNSSIPGNKRGRPSEETFIDYLRSERGFAENSILSYQFSMADFAEYMRP